MFASVLRTGIVWVATGLAGLLSPAPSSLSWQFDLLDQVTESQQPPQPTAPAKLPPTWEFNLVDRPEWNFQLTTADVGDADVGEVVAEPAAWRFTLTDEAGGEISLLPRYEAAYAASKASGRWIMLVVGGSEAEARVKHDEAQRLGMEFAWHRKPLIVSDQMIDVGEYRFAPPDGTACVVEPTPHYVSPALPVLRFVGEPVQIPGYGSSLCANGQCYRR